MLGLKKRLKHWLGVVLYVTGAYRILLRNRAVIVLFHRVDDRFADDPISCSSQTFQNFCTFFRRYFDVIPLQELLDRLAHGADLRASVVITFDDGYLDNRTVAAPVLLKEQLPACFFIATNFIGSTVVPWWDAKSEVAPEWMTWNDVRELRGLGFELGAHTMNHVDLGQVHGHEAAEEIQGSLSRLRQEIQEEISFFSYPFGRRDQLTEENRGQIMEAGFRCCLSAHGGTVARGDDPFRLKRVPISRWFVSPHQFGFELLLSPD